MPFGAFSQMNKVVDIQDFEKRLAQETSKIQSIECDFTQIKYLDVFDEKVTSSGLFSYRNNKNICLEYVRPIHYVMIIADNMLTIVSDGKKTTMNLNANKMIGEMQGMLTACMVGDLSQLKSDYQMDYFEDAKSIMVQIKPLSKAVLAYITEMQIVLEKKDMSVTRLRLSENETDYTEYLFFNKRYNTLNDNAKFLVR